MLKGMGKYKVTANSFSPRMEEQANIASSQVGSGSRSGGHSVSGYGVQGFFTKGFMDGMISETPEQIRKLCYDMYKYDSICGSAVDIISTIPWSQVTLSGISDPSVRSIYQKSIEYMNLMMLMPEATLDYLVKGVFVGAMSYSEQLRHFIGITPQDVDQCEVTPVPFYGRDPFISQRFNEGFKEILKQAKRDPRLAKFLIDNYPDLETNVKNGFRPLDYDTTVYIPRRTLASNLHGASYLQRAIPVFLIEKALMRGTIELSYRRQKSILQIVLGSEDWDPGPEEMSQYVQLIAQADADPTGAIIATRQDVMFNEFRNASDFWRYDEVYDSISNFKMRALGFSEQLLTEGLNISTMETSLSTFLERIRYMRYVITQRLFYNKVFPYLAVKNNFVAKSQQQNLEVTGKAAFDRQGFTEELGSLSLFGRNNEVACGDAQFMEVGNVPFDASKYQMPRINWIKSLKPEADSAYMEILEKLESKNIPIPLRMWAAVGGINISELMHGYEDDIKIRQLVNKHMARIPKPAGGQQGMDEFAQVLEASAKPVNKLKPIGIMNRAFTERDSEMRDPGTGKVLSRKGKKVITERIHKTISAASARIAAQHNYKLRNTDKDDAQSVMPM